MFRVLSNGFCWVYVERGCACGSSVVLRVAGFAVRVGRVEGSGCRVRGSRELGYGSFRE